MKFSLRAPMWMHVGVLACAALGCGNSSATPASSADIWSPLDGGATTDGSLTDGAASDASSFADGGASDAACALGVTQSEPDTACANVVPADTTSFATKIAAAQPGDCITLANGNYTFGAVHLPGTAASPIVIRSQTLGGATVNAGTMTLTGTYAVIQGLTWTTPQAPLLVGVCDHCRITRNFFHPATTVHTDWVVLHTAATQYTQIDHNDFGPETVEGNAFLVFGDDATVASNVHVDHNYFHDIGPFTDANPESQPVRLGNSGLDGSAFAVVEYNLFENANGDPEVISSKSSDNTIRYNTIVASAGTISLRIGDRGIVNGNFVLGNGSANSGGVRMSGNGHEVFDNYIDQVAEGIAFEGDSLDGGIVDGAVLHAQVHDAQVVFNTVLGSTATGLDLQHETLPPADSTIANNLFTQTAGALVHEATTPVALTLAGNIAYLTTGATLGFAAPGAAFALVDPMLITSSQPNRLGPTSPASSGASGTFAFVTVDMDGQPRTIPLDIGADQLSTACMTQRPLTKSDVGPNAP